MKKLSLQPFTVEVLTVNMQTGPENRPDVIGDILLCEIKTKKISRIKCDEPTGF